MAARRAGGGKRGAGRGLVGQEGRKGKEVMVIQNREGRVAVAQQTLAILDSGSFTSPTGIPVHIGEELSQCCSQVGQSLQRKASKHLTNANFSPHTHTHRPPSGLLSSWTGDILKVLTFLFKFHNWL